MEYTYFMHKDYILVRRDSDGRYTWLPKAYNNWAYGALICSPEKLTPIDLNNIPKDILSTYTNPIFKKLLKETFYKDILDD